MITKATVSASPIVTRYLVRGQRSSHYDAHRALLVSIISIPPSNNHQHHHHRTRTTSLQPHRSFSTKQKEESDKSTAKEGTKNNNNDDDGDDYMLLYHRNSSRNVAHRAFFGVSIFNTIYWTWYIVDFVPAVNASPIEDLHIDPTVGIGGIALGLMINSLTVLYPLSTISRLSYSPSKQSWRLWGHSLFPSLLGPDTGKPNEYALGDLTMDRASADTKKVLKDGIEAYSGHLGIAVKGSKFPYLMEIKEPTELPGDKEMFLQALLNPAVLSNNSNNNKKKNNSQIKSRGGKNKKRRRGKR